MANQNKPTGFRPIGHMSGGAIPAPLEFDITPGQVIYEGDPVMVTATGSVTVVAAGTTTTHFGIAAEYVTDAASVAGGKKIKVYIDRGIIYAVQANAAYTASNQFNTGDIITYAVGDATSKKSKMALDTLGTSTLPWLVIGLVDSPDNAWGLYQKVKVVYNLGVLGTAYAGI